MKTVELTDQEARIISEVFEATAYTGHLQEVIRVVAKDCGVMDDVGALNIDDLFQSIWEKTK